MPAEFSRGEVQLCVEEVLRAMRHLYSKCGSRPLNSDETCHAAYGLATAARKLLVSSNNAVEAGLA